MKKSLIYVGLDVHKNSIVLAMAAGGLSPGCQGRSPPRGSRASTRGDRGRRHDSLDFGQAGTQDQKRVQGNRSGATLVMLLGSGGRAPGTSIRWIAV